MPEGIMSDFITRAFIQSVHVKCPECGHEHDVLVSVDVKVSIGPVMCAYCEHPIYCFDEKDDIPHETIVFVEDGVEKEGVSYFHPSCQKMYHKGKGD
jgi:hypothetical protein